MNQLCKLNNMILYLDFIKETFIKLMLWKINKSFRGIMFIKKLIITFLRINQQ